MRVWVTVCEDTRLKHGGLINARSLIMFAVLSVNLLVFCSWYLDVDFQLWLVAPFFVLVAWNHELLGYALGAGIIMASMIHTGSVSH